MASVVTGEGREDEVSACLTEVLRWMRISTDDVAFLRATLPSYRDWLAIADDGAVIGAATCLIPPDMKESAAAFATIVVQPAHRRRGVGTALYATVSSYAREELGRSMLETVTVEDDPDGIHCARAHGFTVAMHSRALRLPLAGLEAPAVEPPRGITVVSLAERPDLAEGMWEVAVEAMPDIPFDGDVPLGPGTFEEYRGLHLEGPRFLPEGTFLALRGERVVGFAKLAWDGGPGAIADHAMLAVLRSERGKGIATVLKAAQIAWAVNAGLAELRTGNEERNAAARAVNAKFPYVPMPDFLGFVGPLHPG